MITVDDSYYWAPKKLTTVGWRSDPAPDRGRMTKGSDMLLAVLIGVSSAVVDNVPLVQATETPRPRSCWDAEKNPKKKNTFFV